MHGWGGDFNNFKGSTEALKGKYTCANVSFFDCEEVCPLYIEDYVKFVRGIIAELFSRGVKNITAVGHSFGGRVGIELAAGGDIDRLVLVDSAGLKPKRGGKYYLRLMRYKILRTLGKDTAQCGSPDYKALSAVRKQTFKNIIGHFQDDKLNKIHIPTLIIWGTRDKDTPIYMAKRFRRGISDSALIMLQGGHYCYLDEYARFNAILDSFAGR